MSHLPLLDFLAGAVTVCYLVAATFFLRFFRRTRDPLFRGFAIAFLLLAANQALVSFFGADDERSGYTYVLRVLGFLWIFFAIIRKNVGPRRPL